MDPTITPPTRAVIVSGGECHSTIHADAGVTVIAADSGYDTALSQGVSVDVLVGDLDSISAAGRRHAEAHDVTIEQHPADKDDTDLALALDRAAQLGATEVAIYGGEGGRLDHLLAGALVIAATPTSNLRITWHTAGATAQIAHAGTEVDVVGSPGDHVSLIPIVACSGVTTTGMRWPLDGAAMEVGTALGVSNQLISSHATVSVTTGRMLVVHTQGEPK